MIPLGELAPILAVDGLEDPIRSGLTIGIDPDEGLLPLASIFAPILAAAETAAFSASSSLSSSLGELGGGWPRRPPKLYNLLIPLALPLIFTCKNS